MLAWTTARYQAVVNLELRTCVMAISLEAFEIPRPIIGTFTFSSEETALEPPSGPPRAALHPSLPFHPEVPTCHV